MECCCCLIRYLGHARVLYPFLIGFSDAVVRCERAGRSPSGCREGETPGARDSRRETRISSRDLPPPSRGTDAAFRCEGRTRQGGRTRRRPRACRHRCRWGSTGPHRCHRRWGTARATCWLCGSQHPVSETWSAVSAAVAYEARSSTGCGTRPTRRKNSPIAKVGRGSNAAECHLGDGVRRYRHAAWQAQHPPTNSAVPAAASLPNRPAAPPSQSAVQWTRGLPLQLGMPLQRETTAPSELPLVRFTPSTQDRARSQYDHRTHACGA